MKLIDLTGNRYGKLTVVERFGTTGSRWLCKCDCGETKVILGANLKSGKSTTCGRCWKRTDIVGNRYGRLVVKKMIYGDKKSKCVCQCDCGNETITLTSSLKGGGTQSCGCLQKEAAQRTGHNSGTHRKSKTRLYRVWRTMKTRIDNPHCKKYKDYGGRGIRICDEWRNDYTAFERWALNNGYNVNAEYGKCTLDRIDVNGDYCPSNCRWVDLKVQANNRRNSHGTEIF